MTSPLRLAHLLALLGGAAWLADTATITILDDAFGVPDTVLFLTGLFSIAFAALAFGVHLAGDRSTALKVLGAVGSFLVAAVVATAVEAGVQGLVDAVYDGGNQGLNEEMGLMAVAVLVLAWAVLAPRAAGRRRGLTLRSAQAGAAGR